jgi:predicted acetyltransferase
LTLEKAKGMALPSVLLTCDADNVGSRRIIEKNGGILQDKVVSPTNGRPVLRFWIDLER